MWNQWCSVLALRTLSRFQAVAIERGAKRASLRKGASQRGPSERSFTTRSWSATMATTELRANQKSTGRAPRREDMLSLYSVQGSATLGKEAAQLSEQVSRYSTVFPRQHGHLRKAIAAERYG